MNIRKTNYVYSFMAFNWHIAKRTKTNNFQHKKLIEQHPYITYIYFDRIVSYLVCVCICLCNYCLTDYWKIALVKSKQIEIFFFCILIVCCCEIWKECRVDNCKKKIQIKFAYVVKTLNDRQKKNEREFGNSSRKHWMLAGCDWCWVISFKAVIAHKRTKQNGKNCETCIKNVNNNYKQQRQRQTTYNIFRKRENGPEKK